MDKISVIMPGYNEGERIYDNLLHTDAVMSEIARKYGMEYEVIFVNDGSRDETCAHAYRAAAESNKIFVINNMINQGKGAALKCGSEMATGTHIVFLDSDLDLPPEQLDGFLDLMLKSGSDVVIGSKMHPDSNLDYPLARKIVSTIYFLILFILFHLNIRDTQTGIKLFKAHVIKPVMRNIIVSGYAYDVEVLATINKLKYSMIAAPIVLNFHRVDSWGRIKIRDIVRTLLDTLVIFMRITFCFKKDLYESSVSNGR